MPTELKSIETDEFGSDDLTVGATNPNAFKWVPGHDYIDDVFSATGLLAGKFKGYKPRTGQIEISRAVLKGIETSRHVLAEGPTGTGKSFALAVPAIQKALQDGNGPVIIVTANIALQEQLMEKDLPLLAEILPWTDAAGQKMKYALIKGRNNYLCADKWDETKAYLAIKGQEKVKISREDESAFKVLSAWAERENANFLTTPESGDKSQLDFIPEERLWRHFSTTSDDCQGSNCGYAKECHALKAKAKAGNAHVIVTNYHILFLHLKLKQMLGIDAILPKFEVCIMDEAHKAPDIAREFFGFQVGPGAVTANVRNLRRLGDMKFGGETADQIVGEVDRASEKFFSDLLAYRKSPSYRTRIKEPGCVQYEALCEVMKKVSRAYMTLAADETNRMLDDAIRAIYGSRAAKMKHTRVRAIMQKASEKAAEIARSVTAAITVDQTEPFAYSIDMKEWMSREQALLIARPIKVDGYLRNTLWNEYKSVSVASATLATAGNFEFITGELGIRNALKNPLVTGYETDDDGDEHPIYEREEGTREHVEIIAENPFDYKKKCLFVVPETMPLPDWKRSDEYMTSCAEHIRDTIKLAHGRTLVLFTSRKAMEHVYQLIKNRTGYHIYKQGDMPRTQLVKKFTEETDSVLFGLESFWAGVDVPGESLSCVIIDKIPFLTPEDPVLDAMSAGDGKAAFRKYSVPKAIIAFKQGFGRLIRTVEDRGVVVLLDRRILTNKGSYGEKFLISIPKTMRSQTLSHVGDFLDEVD